MKKDLFSKLEDLLKTNSKYVSEDDKLIKTSVYSDVMTMDEELLKLLMSDDEVKERFFVKINDSYVFDKQAFGWLINSKEFLPDSYTRFSNKIGLTSNGKFISQNKDVVLDFPYKDCVLEGGQTKEDQKRDEIMYNETIANEEISKLLYPKVFTNAKRYTKDGAVENIKFNDDDNLVIKGNNLLALHSLLKRYEGKVKLAYYDVPYNTGNDSFGYNDNFNHSTWLTFIRNRLEVTKRLLRKDGVFCIQCDDNEQAYLKVLCDEIFDRENYCNTIINQSAYSVYGSRASAKNKTIIKVKDYIIVYFMKKGINIKPQYTISDNCIHESHDFIYENGIKISTMDWFKKNYAEIFKKYDLSITKDNLKLLFRLDSKFKDEICDRLLDIQVRGETYSNDLPDEIKIQLENGKIVKFDDKLLFNENNGTGTTCFMRTLRESCEIIDGKYRKVNIVGDIWDNSAGYRSVAEEGKNGKNKIQLPNGKKPEMLIEKILNMFTNENDIVLDAFLGSGTTGAVCIKMNRQFICVEQLNEHIELSIKRLNNVIQGEKSGVSKSVSWNGGGSFVYCELKDDSNTIIEKIKNATDKNIKKIKDEIVNSDYIIPYLKKDDLKKADDEFNNLSLEDKKKVLYDLVDKNKLYVNYCDMQDSEYNISQADKDFTNSFYKDRK